MDAAIDWGAEVGNSAPQLASAARNAYLADAASVLHSVIEQMTHCVVSGMYSCVPCEVELILP